MLRRKLRKTDHNYFLKRYSPPKYDGVVESVHYTPEGQIAWVRTYERRGPAWSDHVLMDRETLIDRLKAGKRFYTGRRILFEGGEFEVHTPLKLLKTENGEVVVTSENEAVKDRLDGVPVI